MKREVAEAIKQAAEDIGSMGDFSIRDAYVGRGMMGNSTVGLEYESQNDLMVAACYASACLREVDDNATDEDPVLTVDDFIDEVRRFRHDNMGRDFIVY